jgi:hypothetical protein
MPCETTWHERIVGHRTEVLCVAGYDAAGY